MEQEVIELANQIDPTKSVDDLKNGVAFCYILSRELYQDKRLCELKIRVINCSKQDYSSSIRNLSFALHLLDESPISKELFSNIPLQRRSFPSNNISNPISIKHLTGQSLYQDPQIIFQIVSQIIHRQSPLPSKPPKPPQRDDQLFYVDENLVQPNQPPPEEPVANKYRMIKPNSPYSRNDSIFSHSNQVSQQHSISVQQSQQQSISQQPRTITHNTEYIEQFSQKKDSIDTISDLTPIKNNEKLIKLEQEIKSLDNKIEKEQNEITFLNRRSSKTSKSFDQQQLQQQQLQLQSQSQSQSQSQYALQVDEEQRNMIIDWLKQIRLIKSTAQGLQNKLPKICKNGVIFFDLLNRLSGREEVLKGALRNPKNNREIKHNYRRILEYLKQYEKFNYRYLNSEQQLADGNEAIFWGLLLDIKQFYYSQPIPKQQAPIEKQNAKEASPIPKEPVQVRDQSARQLYSPGTYSHLHNAKFDSVNKSLNSLMKRSNLNTSQGGTPVNQSITHHNRHFSSSQQKRPKSTSVSRNCVTREMELYVQTYFKQKQLYNNENLFNDPIRNGQYIFQLLNPDKVGGSMFFKSIIDVENNVNQALLAVSAMVDAGTMPAWIRALTKENIMQLDKQAMGLYWWLLKDSVPKIQIREQVNQFTLPYKQEDIDQLKLITLHWAREICKSINSKNIKLIQVQSFNDMILMCQSGVLFSTLLTELLHQKTLPIHSNPIGEKQCLANIRKALDLLKGKAIGQRFVWREQNIFQGDQLVILGLFEDLRRFQDGLPCRQGDDYFAEGPYLNKIQQPSQVLQPLKMSQDFGKPLSLIDQNLQVSKKLVFEDIPVIINTNNNNNNNNNNNVNKKDWLSQFGYKINWNKEVIEEFKDGLILCQLIQRLEKIELKGIQMKPTTAAGCMSNIRKAFSILKEKIDMPVDLVMDHDKIYQGDKEYLIRLFSTIKTIYRQKIKRI